MQKKSQKSSSKKDQYTVVLEDLRSNFKIFGEALSALDEKFTDRFDAVDQRFEAVDRRFDVVDQRFEGIDKKLGRLEVDMDTVKKELAFIRHHQVTREEIKLLESRVSRLEKLAK